MPSQVERFEVAAEEAISETQALFVALDRAALGGGVGGLDKPTVKGSDALTDFYKHNVSATACCFPIRKVVGCICLVCAADAQGDGCADASRCVCCTSCPCRWCSWAAPSASCTTSLLSSYVGRHQMTATCPQRGANRTAKGSGSSKSNREWNDGYVRAVVVCECFNKQRSAHLR